MKGGQTKRRYRRKRYRRDIEVLREVTADLRSAYHERVPGRTNAYDELICFSTDAGRGDTGRLAIVAFGYDSVCHVVDLGYAAGKGDVDELRHQVDLQVLKSTIARRARRQRNTPPNELEIQLLIRFIVDLNHLLPQRDCGGGAFLAFADGWKTIDFRDPKNATQERIRRRLETIVWSDSAIPCAQPYRVEIHAERLERDLAAFQTPLPPPYDACEKVATTVSSLSLVRYRLNDYSVPTTYGHREVLVRGYVHEVVISCGAETIARHVRSYEREDFVFDPLHYLALLEQKINALDQAAPLAGWQLPEAFATLRRLLDRWIPAPFPPPSIVELTVSPALAGTRKPNIGGHSELDLLTGGAVPGAVWLSLCLFLSKADDCGI